MADKLAPRPAATLLLLRDGSLGPEAFMLQRTRSAAFLAPVEGEVVEVNKELRKNPALATEDPYGRGWVLKLRANDLATNLKNLLSGRMARRWMEESREALELRLMALSGSVLQDGG